MLTRYKLVKVDFKNPHTINQLLVMCFIEEYHSISNHQESLVIFDDILLKLSVKAEILPKIDNHFILEIGKCCYNI